MQIIQKEKEKNNENQEKEKEPEESAEWRELVRLPLSMSILISLERGFMQGKQLILFLLNPHNYCN